MRIFTLLLFTTLLMFSCRTKKYDSLDVAEGKKLILAEGGGFAGMYTTYALLENGQLFKSHGKITQFEEIDGLNKKATKEIFKMYKNMDAPSIENGYGNMTYSLKFENTEDDKQTEVSWTDYQPNSEKYQEFYDFAIKSIKKNIKKSPSENTNLK